MKNTNFKNVNGSLAMVLDLGIVKNIKCEYGIYTSEKFFAEVVVYLSASKVR